MPNSNTPFGAWPRRRLDGVSANFNLNHYYAPATDMNIMRPGDFVVKTAGVADAAGTNGVTLSTSGGRITGVITGFRLTPTIIANGGVRAAGIVEYLEVCDDPEVLFEMQENDLFGGVAGTPLPAASVGKNANFIYGAGVGQRSGTMLDASTVATTAGLQLSIVSFENRPDNTPGLAFGKVLVRINNHTETPGAAGI